MPAQIIVSMHLLDDLGRAGDDLVDTVFRGNDDESPTEEAGRVIGEVLAEAKDGDAFDLTIEVKS